MWVFGLPKWNLSVPMALAGLSDLRRSLCRKKGTTQSKFSDCFKIYLYLFNMARTADEPFFPCGFVNAL